MNPVHVELKDANAFVAAMHRHHNPVVGHRWSVGMEHRGKIVGVAIVGRPVARMTDQKMVVEVLRLCTDGTKNACSALYATCASVAKLLGYEKIQTFILVSETGASLRAAGWTCEGKSDGGDWNRPSRMGRRTDQPMEPKVKWSKNLRVVKVKEAMGDG